MPNSDSNQSNRSKTLGPSNSPSRRSFLATSAAVAGAAVASRGRLTEAAPLSDQEIKVGLVGCGGRGTGAVGQLFATEGPLKLVAMADAFDYRLKDSRKRLAKAAAKTDAGAEGRMDVSDDRCYVGLDAYKKVLESDCDLVVLATPPGFRPDQFEAAVDSGKHIFMEKPVAVDAPGIRRILAAGEKAEANGQAVAVGLQRRHETLYQETIERLQDGAIGDIVLTRVYWNSGGVWTRPRTPEQTEMEYQVNNWYYFNWVCGDQIVEQHIHNIDVSNWLKGMVPVNAQGQGGRQVRTGKEHGQIFDHQSIEYTYPDGTKMLSQSRHISGAWPQVGEYAHGTKGTANIGRGIIEDANGDTIWRFKGRNPQGHQQEQHDLIANLRAGKIPNETRYGAEATMTAILGRLAAYSGKMLKWDDAINSDISLAPERLAWDADPPVMPDEDGRYPVPVPGETEVI